MSQHPYAVDVTKENFQQIVVENSYKVPVLLDFWATWCNPCQVLIPILTKLSDEYNGGFLLAKVDIDAQQELAAHFGVRSVPTVKIIHNGAQVDEFSGAIPEGQIREILDKYVVNEKDQALNQALELYRSGDRDGAFAAVQSMLDAEPDNYKAKLVLAEFLMEEQAFDDVETIIESLPADIRLEESVKSLASRLAFARNAKDLPSEQELQERLANNANDSEARLQLGNLYTMNERYEEALATFLELMKRDRAFQDEAARKNLLQLFEMMGSGDPLVSQYRRKMASLLY